MVKKVFKSRIFLVFILILIILVIRHFLNISHAFYVPDYEFEEVSINDSPDKIFKLTGLSPFASEKMIASGKLNDIKKLNAMFFHKPHIKKAYILFPFACEEKIISDTVPLAPLKTGDILVSFSTHTLDWRHGHLALVVNDDEGIILEHMAIGHNSRHGFTKKWGSYPSFAILRYPDEKKAREAAKYAEEKLTDVPYSIFSGLIKKDKSDKENIDCSHCSHIVWQAYKAVGIDLDINGGKIVTPRDVAMSDKLEVVQIFGLNPQNYESRLKR